MSTGLGSEKWQFTKGLHDLGNRLLRLPPARRELGLEQRGARRRWRRVAAGRHPLRPAHSRARCWIRHAGRRAGGGGADRHVGEHALERRPLQRERARRGRRDHRVGGGRRGDGAGESRAIMLAVQAGGAPAGRSGRVLRALLRRLRVRGDRRRPFPTATVRRARSTRQVGDKRVELIQVGPAHTRGDVLVFVPGDRTIFTGDILFIEGHPIIWAGPVANWIDACRRIEAMDVETVVPGHGPITDKRGVAAMREYLEYIFVEARARYDAGLDRLRSGAGHRPRATTHPGATPSGSSSTSTPSTASSPEIRSCRRSRSSSPRWRSSNANTEGGRLQR